MFPLVAAVLLAAAAAQTSVPQGNPAPPRHTDEDSRPAGRQTNEDYGSAQPGNGPADNTNDSSSKATKIPLTPPPGEPGLNLNEGAPAPGIAGQPKYEWNPHLADHEVEVGDFYFKRKNYDAAIERYREALRWQDNHAIATFRLATALERVGQYSEARRNYQAYLRILPNGQYAKESEKALQRLKDKPDQQKTAMGGKQPATSQK